MKRKSLFKTTIMVSIMIIACKILGFAREAIIAAFYGATAETDAFFFAQGMPGSIFPSVCNSISTAFTAIYVKKKINNEDDNEYASNMLVFTGGLGLLLSLIGVVAAKWLVPIFAPGFHAEQLVLAVHLTRIIMGAFVLTMLQYMFSGILNSNKLFYSAQAANIFNNVVVIVLTLLLGREKSLDALSFAVILGLLANVLVLVISCRTKFHFRFQAKTIAVDSRELLQLSLPIILGNGVIQLNTIVDKALGSTLMEGSLSALAYSNTINSLVTGVFVASLSTVLYPNLAENAASKDLCTFRNNVMQCLQGLSLVLVFITGIVFLDAKNIVSIIFERGSFNASATETTASVLGIYSLMYVFSGIREVLTRAHFAVHDTKTPMINSSIGVVMNIICSVLFVKYIGIKGIALGTVIANIAIAFLLIRSIKKNPIVLDLTSYLVSLLKQFFAGAIAITVLILLHIVTGTVNQYVRFLLDASIGGVIYVSLLYLLKDPGCSTFISLLKNRLLRD